MSIKLYSNPIFKSYKYQFDSIDVAMNYLAIKGHNLTLAGEKYGLTTVHFSLSVYKSISFFSNNVENFIDALTKKAFKIKMKKRERKMIRVDSINFEKYNEDTGYSSLELDISYPTSYFYRCFLKTALYNKLSFKSAKTYVQTMKKDEYNRFVACLLYNNLKPIYGDQHILTTIKIIEEVPFYRYAHL